MAFTFGTNTPDSRASFTPPPQASADKPLHGLFPSTPPSSIETGDIVIYHNIIGKASQKHVVKVGGLVNDQAKLFKDLYWLVEPEKEANIDNTVIIASKKNLVKPKYPVGAKILVKVGGGKLEHSAVVRKVDLVGTVIQYQLELKSALMLFNEAELE